MAVGMQNSFFIYGPPGSGKSTIGRVLARNLALPFHDLDQEIEVRTGRPVAEIFSADGEVGFRRLEADCLAELLNGEPQVLALGGGALLDERSRERVEAAGQVLCLTASLQGLLARLQSAAGVRPLLGPPEAMPEQLFSLMEGRARHYASFPLSLDTSNLPARRAAWRAQTQLGAFRVQRMREPYDVRVRRGGLEFLGESLRQAGLKSPVVLVTDTHTGPLYARAAASSLEETGYRVSHASIPAGEDQKNLGTVQRLWQAFLDAGLERSGTVVALGGGVLGDLAGFAAATYLRGVRWVNLPTTLLAMVDASLGGKTGADLPQGKNLVGAFHPPSLVLVDPALLASLPRAELRNGLAEAVKHGIIGDAALFSRCAAGWESVALDWEALIRQAMAVKIRVIEADPYEKGERGALNLGHTIGHALESASGYRLRHGEAVSIGLVAEARLAERIGLAQPGLSALVASVLASLGLPVEISSTIDRARLLAAMEHDKKKTGGSVRFTLPQGIGKVKTGISLNREDILWTLEI